MASLVPCLILAAACAFAPPARRGRWLGALACAAVLAVFAWRFAIVPEDTFISMRYARNLVEGNGLVYNAGERVEGYTNFLWTLVLALVHAVGAPPLETTVVVSIVLAAAAAGALALGLREATGHDGLAWSAAALVLLPAFWDAAGSGLETSLYTALLTGAALLQAADVRTGRRAGRWNVILLALAALTRPEGIFAAGLLCGAAFLARRGERRFGARQVTIFGTVALVVLVHVLWRRLYYGDWVPNTFHCKVGASWAQFRRGAEQLLQFLRTGNGLLLVPCAAAPWLLRRRPWLLPPLALGAGYAAYVVAIGGDNFWRHRYLVPVLPALLLVSEAVVREVAGAAAQSLPRGARSTLGAAFLVALWGSVDGIKLVPHAVPLGERFAWERRLGAWLTERTPEGRSVAVMAAGVVPYYTQRPVIDMFGLCDAHIARVDPPDGAGARNAGHEKYDFDYVLSREPEFALMSIPTDLSNADSLLHTAFRRDPALAARWAERYEEFTYEDAGRRRGFLRFRR